MTTMRGAPWIVVVGLAGMTFGFSVGRLSAPTPPPRARAKAMRSGRVRLSPAALEQLKSIPVRKAGKLHGRPERFAIERVPAVGDRPVFYSLMQGQSITVTPTAAFSDFVGTVASGTIYEFTGEPTSGSQGGYVYVQSASPNQPPTDRSYAAVSLLDVPAGQRYLVDFVASAVNDGGRGINCQWILRAGDIDIQRTPCAVSTPNASKEQHVFVVLETVGGHFNYVGLSNEAQDGASLFWEFESATVTRVL